MLSAPSPLTRIGSLALLASLAACSGAEGDQPPTDRVPADSQARTVRSVPAREETWEQVLRVNGELTAFEVATLSAKVPGRLLSLDVDLGSRVKRGQPVAVIDARDYELRLAQAEAALEAARARLGGATNGGQDVEPEDTAIVREARSALEDARRELDRIQTLLADGVAAQSALDSAQARHDQAESRWQAALEEVATRKATLAQRQAELELARQQLADAHLAAPFDGAVAARLAGTGDYVQVGEPVVRLVRFDPLRLRLEVPERSSALLSIGQEVRVTLEGGVEAPGGRIARISPEISARNRTLLVEAEFQNADGRLRPGSFARAQIVLDAAARTLVIPTEALVRFAGVDKVFVVEDGVVAERRVTVGRIEGPRVEVLANLEAGTQVVLAPGSLQTGERVVVEQK